MSDGAFTPNILGWQGACKIRGSMAKWGSSIAVEASMASSECGVVCELQKRPNGEKSPLPAAFALKSAVGNLVSALRAIRFTHGRPCQSGWHGRPSGSSLLRLGRLPYLFRTGPDLPNISPATLQKRSPAHIHGERGRPGCPATRGQLLRLFPS